MDGKDTKRKRGLFDSVFPREHDFGEMLLQQARTVVEGTRRFVEWMEGGGVDETTALEALEEEADRLRYQMEDRLTEAFSTPYDRQEIYGLSRQMDYVLNFAVETAREMRALSIGPDEPLLTMSRSLLDGVRSLMEGVEMLVRGEGDFEAVVRKARNSMHSIDDTFIDALGRMYDEPDLRAALKKREVYHHMREAGRSLRTTVDVLHRMKVDLF